MMTRQRIRAAPGLPSMYHSLCLPSQFSMPHGLHPPRTDTIFAISESLFSIPESGDMGNELVQSLMRGLDVLEFAAAAEQGLTLTEIADRLGVKPPTAFNIGKTLIAKGYLEKTSRPVRYRLGPAALDLAAARERRLCFRQAADVVRALFDELGSATVLLGEPVGGEIRASLRIDPARPEALERFPNWPLAPYTTAVALCFQAFWSGPQRAGYRARHPFSEYGMVLWREPEALEAFLRDARGRGFVAVDSSDPFRVAAPVYGVGQQLIAGLGASSSHTPDSSSRSKMIEAVTAGAQRLSQLLGRA